LTGNNYFVKILLDILTMNILVSLARMQNCPHLHYRDSYIAQVLLRHLCFFLEVIMRIGLMGHNSVEYIEHLLGIWNNNDSAVLIDYDMPAEALRKIIADSHIVSLRIEESLSFKFVNESLPAEIVTYSVNTKLPCFLPERIYDNFDGRYDGNEALVIFSSGTTGLNKGISLSHRAINNNANSIIDYMQPIGSDCLYLNKKLSHSSSLTGELLVALKTRTRIVVAPIIIPPRIAFRYISDFSVSILCCNPTLLNMYTDEAERTNHFPAIIRTIYTSGDIIPAKAIDRARSVLKRPVYNVYGQTECGPRISAQTEDCCHGNSVGKPINNVEVRLDDNGEILVRTNALFSGYTNFNKNIEEWHRTGDVGSFDENGELNITGRADNMIVIGAHNVYPENVERTIIANTSVIDCVVYKNGDLLCCDYFSDSENEVEIVKRISPFLMKHEIPNSFQKVTMIATNKNGKKIRKSETSNECSKRDFSANTRQNN